LCGGPNACGLEAGATTCWCFETRIPAAVLDTIPAEQRNRSCICQTCATAGVTPATPALRGRPAMIGKTYTTTIVRDDPMCIIPVPFDPKPVFGKVRAPVRVTLNGYTFRSTISAMGGPCCIPLRKSHREAAGLVGGETLQVELALDTAPRTVTPPADLDKALKAASVVEAWKALSFTHRREHVEAIEGAKKPETRRRRIEAAVAMVAAKAQATAGKPSTARSGGTHSARARASRTTSKL
jgi:hypothetical protein